MYTIEELSKINQRYLGTHLGLTEGDLCKANDYVQHIEKSRSTITPKVGDILIYTNKYGDYHARAHIEKIHENSKAYICETPYVPFVSKNGNEISCNTSGGAWIDLSIKEFKYVGTSKKTFCDWGSCGACADGAIEFEANVSVWQYQEEGQLYIDLKSGQPFTTQYYNKHYISYRAEPNNNGYRFFGDSIAWKNQKDFQAWLRTFRGVVFKGNWENQIIVWTWKENKQMVSPEEFESINGIDDVILLNGLLKCKRVYDKDNHIVNTYYVWSWGLDVSSDDFYKTLKEHRKIVEKYYRLDNTLHCVNEFAAKELEFNLVQPVNLEKFLKL